MVFVFGAAIAGFDLDQFEADFAQILRNACGSISIAARASPTALVSFIRLSCPIYLTILDKMSDKTDTTSMRSPSVPLPAAQALRKLGRDLALARRKRRISTADMAARLFVSRDTLWRLERGDPSVSVGTLSTAAFILQLHDRLANLAAPSTDALALALEEEHVPKKIHRRKS